MVSVECDGHVPTFDYVDGAPLCKYTKKCWIASFKEVNFVTYELQLQEAIKIKL